MDPGWAGHAAGSAHAILGSHDRVDGAPVFGGSPREGDEQPCANAHGPEQPVERNVLLFPSDLLLTPSTFVLPRREAPAPRRACFSSLVDWDGQSRRSASALRGMRLFLSSRVMRSHAHDRRGRSPLGRWRTGPRGSRSGEVDCPADDDPASSAPSAGGIGRVARVSRSSATARTRRRNSRQCASAMTASICAARSPGMSGRTLARACSSTIRCGSRSTASTAAR